VTKKKVQDKSSTGMQTAKMLCDGSELFSRQELTR
jgi:hypothetical protein